jgi:CheY-like chemotaxis protein
MLLKDKRIFIIEDNVNNFAIMATILQQHGAQTGFERWGDDTIKRLQAFAPVDLILLDLMFPRGISGYQIFDQIHGIPAFANVPIVAVTAADPAIEMPKARRKGFAGFISKPIRFGQFEKQIAEVFNKGAIWYSGS